MSNLRRLRSGLRIVAAWGVLAAILACGGGDDDSGDDNSDEGSGGSSANSFMVRPGFMPDPRTATGEAGGPFDASTRDPNCRGWIGAVSDHTLHVTSPFNYLRVVVSSPQDTTLVIQLSNGEYRCNDDSEGLNPMVEGSFPSGIHRIYVGTYARNATANYTIAVSELRSTTAASIGGGTAAAPGTAPTPTPTPSAGGTSLVQLRPGFMPDPHTATGTAGGPMAARQLTGNAQNCRGHLPNTPQHTLMAQAAFPRLRVLVNSGTVDTSLVIRTPNGQWFCDDDGGEGFNPMFEGAFPQGTYQVWVGTYSSSAPPAPYTIGFTELQSVTTNSLPAPGAQ